MPTTYGEDRIIMDQETADKLKTFHRIEHELREASDMVDKDSQDYKDFQAWLDSIKEKQNALRNP